MPFRVNPRSHSARANLLRRAIQSATGDRAEGREYVSQAWIDQASAFLQIYQPRVDAITRHLGLRSMEVRERDAAVARLSTCVRHGWQVLKMRVQRQGLPDGVLRLYGLPLDGNVPSNATPDGWLRYARLFVEGDAAAIARGHEPMCNPSAAEIQTVLDVAAAEVDDVSAADAALDEAQAAAEADQAQAEALIADLVAHLVFNLRRMDAPSQRRIMRRYGFKFHYGKGEARDPDDVLSAE
jgi:hypothetical protein